MGSMRTALTILGLFGVLAWTACSDLTSDPFEGLKFRAPAGWTSTDILSVHVFASPGGGELIILDSLPADVDAERQEWSGSNIRNPRNVVRREVKICGTTTAHHEKALVFFARTFQDMNAEMVTVRRGDQTLVATYLYPTKQPPNEKAAAAIYELCPAKK